MHPDNPPSAEELAKIETRLHEELAAARTAYHAARAEAANLHRVEAELGLNHPDHLAAIRNAARIESQALQHYSDVVKAFNAFVLEHKLPRPR